MKRPQKNKTIYSIEFQQEAIELAKKTNNTEAASQLGVSEATIRNWKKKFHENPLIHEKKSYSELEKEVKRLSRELGYMKEINKVLKKSTAIFSKDVMGDLK